MVDLSQRQERATESLLEDEALTAGLDDTAANELINWGIDCVGWVFQQVDGLNGTEIEKTLSERMYAIRRLMRFISRWSVKRTGMDSTALADWTSQVYQALGEIYSGKINLPIQERFFEFINQQINSNPKDMIINLRSMVEKAGESPAFSGEKNKNLLDLIYGFFGGDNG